MSKPIHPAPAMSFCGIDVSAATLEVAVQPQGQPCQQRCFDNSPRGHRALIAWLHQHAITVRVSLEATGT